MPAPGFSLETTLANERVWSVCDAVVEAWEDLRQALIGAIEYDDCGTPHLHRCEREIPGALHRVREAERLAHAEAAATRAMLNSQIEEED